VSSHRADPLIITLPPEIGARIQDLASEQSRSPEEIVSEACARHLAARDTAALEEQYRRGYETIPEDAADLRDLLSHLAVPDEAWS